MKRFLIKLLIFLAIPAVSTSILQFYSDKGLRKSCSFLYKEWNDIRDGKINSDLVVIGSSRAWVHISPKVLDTALNLNSYNLGLDGYNFLMQYYRFKLFLRYNKKPSYIIQTLETNTLARRPNVLNYQQFLPYLNEPEIQEAIGFYKGLDFKDVYIPMYKYRNDLDTMMLGIKTCLHPDLPCNTKKYKGFESSDESWNSEFDQFVKLNPKGYREKLDTLTINLFDSYLAFCKANKIQVILVYPPEYYEANKYVLNRDSILGIYKTFAGKYSIPFLDYTASTLSESKEYFYNSQHLNTKGVNLFNQILVEDMKKLMAPGRDSISKIVAAS